MNKNKKILILGTNTGCEALVKYSKSIGIFTIVTDNLPVEKSVPKQLADMYWDISTRDFDSLLKKCIDEEIDAVLAGTSEYNLKQALRISEELSLPFYCNREQWELINDKNKFKSLCLKYNINVPNTYFVGNKIDTHGDFTFPIIIKPVDGNSSRGVSICNNYDEISLGYKDALKYSISGEVIIEEFIDGKEFTALYSICDGIPSLSSMDIRYDYYLKKNTTSLPIARVFPSPLLDEYINKVNSNVLSLINEVKINNGVFFVQGMYQEKNKKFVIFEGGLRCEGTVPYIFIEKINGINFMNLFVDQVIFGKNISFDLNKEDPHLKGKKVCLLAFISKGGKIDKILGLNAIEKIPEIIEYEKRYNEGDIIPNTFTLSQIVLRFKIVCEDLNKLKNIINIINSTVKVLDENDNELCIKFDESIL